MAACEHLVKRYTERYGPQDDDGLQVARLGLLRAARKFDPARGSNFDSYAWRHIFAALQRQRRARKSKENQRHTLVNINEGEPTSYTIPVELLDLEKALCRLGEELPRHAFVVRRRLQGALLNEIAEELQLSRERIRQMEAGAIHRMRRWLNR